MEVRNKKTGEPKYFWYIDDFIMIRGTEGEFTNLDLATFAKKDIEKLKAIGNYFETEEEAEKAVEKLKAWKRLKDRGFKWGLIGGRDIEFSYPDDCCNDKSFWSDLDLLFGGKE